MRELISKQNQKTRYNSKQIWKGIKNSKYNFVTESGNSKTAPK